MNEKFGNKLKKVSIIVRITPCAQELTHSFLSAAGEDLVDVIEAVRQVTTMKK